MKQREMTFPTQLRSNRPKALPNAFRKMSAAFGLLPTRWSATFANSVLELNPAKRRLPANRSALVLSLILTILATSPHLCRAQEGPPSADKDPVGKNQERDHADSDTQGSGRGRILGFIPAYGLVEEGSHPTSLTAGQKFKLASQYINPYTFVFVAAEAGVNQARNHPSDFGQGAEGYAKRYGAGFADGLSDGLFVTGVYPSLLHQDPRYYRLGDGGLSRRTWYAASRILVTRQDSGRKQFNFSEVLGSFSSATLAMTYYPESQRDVSDVLERAAVQFAFDAGFNVLKEFYPEIERRFFRRNRRQ